MKEAKWLTRACDVERHPWPEGGSDPNEWKPVVMKKPTRELCKRELWTKLALKKNAPNDFSDPKGVVLGRVIDVLLDVAESPEHVQRIVEGCEAKEHFPDGYTIRQVAMETCTTERRPDPSCQKCDGSGFPKPVTRGGYSGVPADAEGRPLKCDCWRVVEKAAS